MRYPLQGYAHDNVAMICSSAQVRVGGFLVALYADIRKYITFSSLSSLSPPTLPLNSTSKKPITKNEVQIKFVPANKPMYRRTIARSSVCKRSWFFKNVSATDRSHCNWLPHLYISMECFVLAGSARPD